RNFSLCCDQPVHRALNVIEICGIARADPQTGESSEHNALVVRPIVQLLGAARHLSVMPARHGCLGHARGRGFISSYFLVQRECQQKEEQSRHYWSFLRNWQFTVETQHAASLPLHLERELRCSLERSSVAALGLNSSKVCAVQARNWISQHRMI